MYVARVVFLLFELVSFSVASQLANLRKAYNVTDIEKELLNFPDGSLQVFGDFDTLTFPKYEGQENFTQTITSDTNSRGIVYYSNDTFISLIEGSTDTRVQKIVPFGLDSFILSGSGTLLEYELENQLFYNLSDLSIRPIFSSSLGEVEAILVDYPLVYFGGNFTVDMGSSVGHSVVIWNYTNNSTSLAPFGGFGQNSRVNSINKLDSDNILFSGCFFGLDNETWWDSTSRNACTSDTADIEIGSLVPLQLATWNAGSSSFDASKFICPDSEQVPWLESSTYGSLECSLPFEVSPQKIRIYNSPNEDSGVSLFRIVTNPSGGIMNLTYVDPLSGKLRYCDAFCPLLQRSILEDSIGNANSTQAIRTNNGLTSVQWSESFQDFAFVNAIGVSGVQFFALNSYGDTVGLSSFQLYRDTISVYANNTLNDLGCGSNVARSSSSLSDDDWHTSLAQKSYLISEFEYSQDSGPKATFEPEINGAGQYTVNVYTPGCVADNTCSSRSIVNVTMWSGEDSSILASTLLYQNNQEEKYDQLYFGHLESSPTVTLQFHSSIFLNNPSNIVVADRIELIPHTIDALTNQTNNDSALNGMFLYQLSNDIQDGDQNSTYASNTTINSYAVENFPKNSSLFSLMLDSTLWVGGSVSGVAMIELDDNLNVTSANKLNVGGTVQGLFSYSDGILLLGSFNLSSRLVNTITYNGSFDSLGYLNTTVETFANVSLHGMELLVFNNEFVFNTTSNEYISNSSAFALSLWSAGQNEFGDLLLSGAVSEAEYTNLSGSAEIFNNGSLITDDFGANLQPYMGLRLNDTTTAYAHLDDTSSKLMLNNGSIEPWSWPGAISFMRYLNNGTFLAVGSNSPSKASLVSLLNLTTFEVSSNLTMSDDAYVSSAIFFGKNSSILIGGNYSISDSDCRDLCLYDYDQHKWSKFANGSINGNITDMKLSDTYDLLVSGTINFEDWTSVNLASFNMTSSEINPLLWNLSGPPKSFIESEAGILLWNDTSLLNYRTDKWEDLTLSSNLIWVIDSVIGLNKTPALDKRDTSVSELGSIVVAGRLKSAAFESSTGASLYDFVKWTPYYITGKSSNDDSTSMALFTNEELSGVYDSQSYLPSPNHTTTSAPSSSASSNPGPIPTATSTGEKKKEIDRGFVVLIGLALAFGTVVVLGITGVLLALIFNFDNGYEQVIPRTNESEMMDTVPPEKLLEFL